MDKSLNLGGRTGNSQSAFSDHCRRTWLQQTNLPKIKEPGRPTIKGIVPEKKFVRPNLIFWIVMGCGEARFGLKGQKHT